MPCRLRRGGCGPCSELDRCADLGEPVRAGCRCARAALPAGAFAVRSAACALGASLVAAGWAGRIHASAGHGLGTVPQLGRRGAGLGAGRRYLGFMQPLAEGVLDFV